MVLLWMFWKTLIAFSILFVSQTIFIVYFWSNNWYVARNVQGKGSTTYTLLVGFNSYCLKNSSSTKPHCYSLLDKADSFENYGVQLSIDRELLGLLHACKFIYVSIIISQFLMAVGIIGKCRYSDDNEISSSDVLFSLSSIIDVILKISLSTFLFLGYNREIGANINGNKIYSSFGSTAILFITLLMMIVVVNFLMLSSFVKSVEKCTYQRGEKYLSIE